MISKLDYSSRTLIYVLDNTDILLVIQMVVKIMNHTF